MVENSTGKEDCNWAVGLAQAVAAQGFGVPMETMTAPETGEQRAVRARQVAMYLSRMVLKRGPCEIARAFRRTHPAVLNACRRVEEAREDPGFDRTVEWLETVLRRAAGATP
jgi:chromosomal replication initiation ATPase DnaA